jgi:hypothetical protein
VREELLAHALLGASVLVLFARVVGFPFIAFDDVEFILHNPQVTQPTASLLDLLLTPRVGYTVPVTVAVEAVLHRVSGGQPWSFHAAALALHVIYASQLLAFMRALGARLSFACLGALVFALHPLIVQPVSWAICLKDLLMANLLLAATRTFLRGARGSHVVLARHCWLAIVLSLLSMLAKPSATPLGFAWLAYLLARFLRDRALPAGAVFFATLTAGLGMLVGAASRFSHDTFIHLDEHEPWTPRTPLVVLGRQLAHVVWPNDLLIVYPDPSEQPSPLLALVGALCLLLALWLAWRTRREPEIVLVLALAAATYLPTSNLLPFGRVMSDSYMYVPLSAVLAACVLALGRALERRSVRLRTGALLALGALALCLAWSTNAQLERWRGGNALWAPVVRAFPRLAIAHRLMGDEQLFRGHPTLAAKAYLNAYALHYDPRYLLQLGTILGMADRTADAECVLIEAIAFGVDRGYATFNYAALLSLNTAYQSHYPSVAKQLLAELDVLRRAGKVAWPQQLEPGLALQRERLRAQPSQPLSWPQRNCAVLQMK